MKTVLVLGVSRGIGKPHDIASIAYHILTESSWMAGQVIKVDGGKSKLL